MINHVSPSGIRIAFALRNIKGVGRAKLRTLLPRLFQCQEKIANISFNDVVRTQLGDQQLASISEDDLGKAWTSAQRIFDETQKLDLHVYLFGWPTYPSQLQRLKDPPSMLFVRGSFNWTKPAIAVIGTRRHSPWGEATAKACATTLAELGSVVVSGLALGIDSIAQNAVVDKEGATWAVLAHGLDTVSPSANRELAARIIEGGGALISEYPPGEHAQRSYFVERDRIQAGLAQAILVIETGIKGGSMHTVNFGREAAIPIWVTFPERKLQESVSMSGLPETQQGTWVLLREGATRVVSPSDLSSLWQSILVKQNANSEKTDFDRKLFE